MLVDGLYANIEAALKFSTYFQEKLWINVHAPMSIHRELLNSTLFLTCLYKSAISLPISSSRTNFVDKNSVDPELANSDSNLQCF